MISFCIFGGGALLDQRSCRRNGHKRCCASYSILMLHRGTRWRFRCFYVIKAQLIFICESHQQATSSHGHEAISCCVVKCSSKESTMVDIGEEHELNFTKGFFYKWIVCDTSLVVKKNEIFCAFLNKFFAHCPESWPSVLRAMVDQWTAAPLETMQNSAI